MKVLAFFIVSLLSNNGMTSAITSVVRIRFCSAITTGIVIRSMVRQAFTLPILNMVSLRTRLILFSSSELKDSK